MLARARVSRRRVRAGMKFAMADAMPRRPVEGNKLRMPPRRPATASNPMEDPLVWTGKLTRRTRRLRPRARDRVEFTPSEVRRIRAKFDQSRAQFARMMGICKETLRNWERGRRYPVGPSRALLRIAASNPDVVAAVLIRNINAWDRGVDPYEDDESLE